MRVAVVIAVLAASCLLATASAQEFGLSFSGFMEWTHVHAKVYESPEEMNVRYKNFLASGARVAERNAEHVANGGDAIFGLTKFADMSPEEFKSQQLTFKPKADRNAIPVQRPNLIGAAPTSYDWTDHGAVTPVKDQGQCGSCWAFSATEEVESMNYLYGPKTLFTLSPEQIVDCDSGDYGCSGGDTISAYQYIQSAGGLESESDYPYTAGDSGEEGSCAFQKSRVKAGLTNYTYATPGCTGSCSSQNETLLLNNLYSTGPVSICVNAEPWQDYNGGIMKSGCSHSYSSLDHCVQLVGYNRDSSSGYWIVRNSWNTNWGEEGLIYIEIGKNLCGVADEATFVFP